MFDTLSDRLSAVFTNLRGKGRLSEADIDATAREIRIALLEADVALPVVREFIAAIKERAKGEARMSVSKLMDEANFRIGDELRTELRAMHRSMRDHFTAVNDQRLRQAADAVRTAAEASQNGAGSAGRVTELQNNLAELRQIRVRVTPGR